MIIYLAVLIDVYSRKCVGWHICDGLDTSLALTALKRALESRKHLGLAGLIHHSDRGVQYASGEYTEYLKSHGISISMSRKGCPQDNPYAESFIKTVKVEEVYTYIRMSMRTGVKPVSASPNSLMTYTITSVFIRHWGICHQMSLRSR
jgi:transposase InsO family protein